MANFKARARTLEMLGRQQISGIPTAISELFKNAHDAYADRVEVDYYRSDGLFVLRDDGIGMTKEDFEERWLTLGTDSQIRKKKGLAPPPRDPNKTERPILGEKGIGRLAIATIGPQVLILTRAKRNGVLCDLVAAYIHWGLFELPGIDLNEIVVPLRVYRGGTLPSKNDIEDMLDEVVKGIKKLAADDKIEQDDTDRLCSDIIGFSVDPEDIDSYLLNPSLKGDGHGTHFIIYPADESIQLALDGESEDAPKLTKTLLGFTNTMIPGTTEPVIHASFRDHKAEDFCTDLIKEQEFFTSEEFEMADHHIQGTFDEYGQFTGTVTIYGEEKQECVVPWNWQGVSGKKTYCGPFRIDVAYIHAEKGQTKLPPEQHALLINKLNRLGGLYIYKDGIRILPYGNTDVDFLDFEIRRSKSASYYFFSYRRMFGAIQITRKNNSQLIEKAGREGFQENKAYRQFRDILIKLFTQIAADFFREWANSPKAEFFLERRAELERIHKARAKLEKMSRQKKKKFSQDLEIFFTSVNKGEPERDIQKLLEIVLLGFRNAAALQDSDESSLAFLNTESSARRDLEKIRLKYKIVRTRGFGLGKALQHDWEAYVSEYERLERDMFSPAELKIEEIASDAAVKYKFAIDRRKRLVRALEDTCGEAKRTTNTESRETKEKLNLVSENVTKLIREVLVDIEDEINRTMSQINKLEVSTIDDADLVAERIRIESALLTKAEKNKEVLDSIQAQLDNITWVRDDSGEIITSVDIKEALEEELQTLREKADVELELTQLGTAVGIIHHEFERTTNAIRNNIRRLKAWADVNEDLVPLYSDIRSSFEHLDGYLTLFTPLNKRLYRQVVPIIGADIIKYMEDVFVERLSRHNIDLTASEDFKKKTISGYPSTFYPVFVNVIDNAIYWLKDQSGTRLISLDADDNGFIISNTGPEIPARFREIIFDQGFSSKAGGRGLGLYIARETLLKVGWSISVTEPEPGMNVTFKISDNKSSIKGGEVN